MYYNNKDLAIEKGLVNGNDNSLYMEIANLYKSIFTEYLFSKIELKKYDDEIANSVLDFYKVKVINPTYNMLDEYNGMNYIYILNNFFVENLSDKNLEIFKNSLINDDINDEKLSSIVDSTYKDVLKMDCYGEKNQNFNVCYGSSAPFNFARNDALVLKIYYGITEHNEEKEEALERFKKIDKFIDELSKQLKTEIEEKLNINCDILTEQTI